MTRKTEVRFEDFIAAQVPDQPLERIAVLEDYTVSETSTWIVDGKEKCGFTWPELDAFLEAAISSHGQGHCGFAFDCGRRIGELEREADRVYWNGFEEGRNT